MAKKNEQLAREARVAVEKWRQYFKRNIDQYHTMMDFVLGRQWSDDECNMLKTFKKVPLQFNKLATMVNSLLGEQQQNTPQLEIVPLTPCDEQTASVRQNIVKDIMLSTDAKTVYQVAACQAFIGGFGSFLVDRDYAHSRSFDQDIKYRYFRDSSRNFWDVGAEHINKIDGMCCGTLTRVTRERFRQMYGEEVEQDILTQAGVTQTKEEIALATDPGLKDDSFSWADNDGITVIDYWKRTYQDDTLYKLSNGEAVTQAELDDLIEKSLRSMPLAVEQDGAMLDEYAGAPLDAMMPGSESIDEPFDEGESASDDDARVTLFINGEPVRIEGKREIKKSVIKHYQIAGAYILDETEFPSEDLPLIFMDQNSYYDRNGKQVCRPFVIDAVDAQRYLNYLGTQSAFILKISRYDQFMASKKNVQSLDTQAQWRDPYTVKGALTYDESPSGAKPEQIRPPELSASLTQQYQRANEDLYTSTGLYPTRLGDQGNEVSGAAIDARTRQGSYATYVAFNSVNRAIAAGGVITNQMIPRVYDTERVISLMTPDQGRQNIVINRQVDEFGEIIENDLRKGTFEVRLQPGASYEGQKQEAINSLNMVLQANPQLLNLFADLYAENLPLSNTLEIKNRLKTIVPPAVIEAGKTGRMPQETGQQQPSPEEQAMQADIQYKQEQINLKKMELAIKQQETQAQIEIEKMKLEIAQLEFAGDIEQQRLRFAAESDRTNTNAAIAHADNLVKILTHKPQNPARHPI